MEGGGNIEDDDEYLFKKMQFKIEIKRHVSTNTLPRLILESWANRARTPLSGTFARLMVNRSNVNAHGERAAGAPSQPYRPVKLQSENGSEKNIGNAVPSSDLRCGDISYATGLGSRFDIGLVGPFGFRTGLWTDGFGSRFSVGFKQFGLAVGPGTDPHPNGSSQ